MKITKVSPALPKTAYTVLNNLVDFILHFSFSEDNEKERCIYTKPEETRDAGDRTGRLPDKIDFKKENEAVEKLIGYFSGKEVVKSSTSNKKVVKKMVKK
jgi:hypothetical protein